MTFCASERLRTGLFTYSLNAAQAILYVWTRHIEATPNTEGFFKYRRVP